MELLSGIASLASIAGAIFAWRQATNAKKFADKAEIQVAKARRIADLSVLKIRWDDAYKFLAVFGPSSSENSLRGRSQALAARKVQDYVVEVTKCQSSLKSLSELDKRIGRINAILGDFSSSQDTLELKEKGSLLIQELGHLDAGICSILQSDREDIQLS